MHSDSVKMALAAASGKVQGLYRLIQRALGTVESSQSQKAKKARPDGLFMLSVCPLAIYKVFLTFYVKLGLFKAIGESCYVP